jgi:hypothetical protein
MPQTLPRNAAERIHVQVAHQERYQLRKQRKLIINHDLGLHKNTKVLTCNRCVDTTRPTRRVEKALERE